MRLCRTDPFPLSPQAIAAGFPSFGGVAGSTNDADYDGRSDMLETNVDGTNPNDPTSVAPCRLGYWRFDTEQLMAEQGQIPISQSGVTLSNSWSGMAASIGSSAFSHLTCWDVYTNGWANVNCRQGSLRFWFKPNGGASGDPAPFVYLGSTSGSDEWALNLNSSANTITFVTKTNGTGSNPVLSASASCLSAGHWTQIVLNYGPSSCALYTNGILAATNSAGNAYWPSQANRSLGMVIGNTTAYNASINGQFDEMETFNCQLATSDIAANFQIVQAVDTDLDGIPDLLQDIQLPTNRPFLGAPVVIAGTVEAEQFDMGGPGIGYYTNVGNGVSNAYRPTGMIITTCDDLGGGYCLDQTHAGDWTEYTVNVLVPQTYMVEVRAEAIGTNVGGVFDCEFSTSGVFYTNTGPLVIPTNIWTNVSAVVYLTNGINITAIPQKIEKSVGLTI